MYYYLWMLAAAMLLIVIATIMTIKKMRIMKSYRNTIRKFNEIHMKIEKQIIEDSFNIWDTVYLINDGDIVEWTLDRIVEEKDSFIYTVRTLDNDFVYCEQLSIFKTILDLIEYYQKKFVFILNLMDETDGKKPTKWNKKHKLKK